MSTLHLNSADYVILGVILISTLISLIRGFVKEAISLATWGLAAWVTFNYGRDFSEIFKQHIHNIEIRIALAMVILFILVLIAGAMVNFTVGHAVSKTGLSGTDRLLGLVFGAGRGILMVTVLLTLLALTPFQKDDWYQASNLIPKFQPLTTWFQDYIPSYFSEHLPAAKRAAAETTEEAIDSLSS